MSPRLQHEWVGAWCRLNHPMISPKYICFRGYIPHILEIPRWCILMPETKTKQKNSRSSDLGKVMNSLVVLISGQVGSRLWKHWPPGACFSCVDGRLKTQQIKRRQWDKWSYPYVVLLCTYLSLSRVMHEKSSQQLEQFSYSRFQYWKW